MRFYADRPQRRRQQIVADVLGPLWCAGMIVAGLAIRHSIRSRTRPATFVESTAGALAAALADTAESIARVPLVGDALSESLQRAADAAGRMSASGASTAASIERAGDVIGLVVIVLALAAAAYVWVRPRVIWYRQASDARAVLAFPDRDDLLSARALAAVRLPRIGGGLVAGWRAGDTAAVGALVRAELDRLGLDYPADLSPDLSPEGQGALTGRNAS
ncbi:hypothetical protein [Jiangella endophytica]|uniref:hypothetical protein n=1 Tax=Jiangella endophytica TaxID=1623398 RepID=UPI000E353BB6|nr:hypothetical protein [Jiangella endophytica]